MEAIVRETVIHAFFRIPITSLVLINFFQL